MTDKQKKILKVAGIAAVTVAVAGVGIYAANKTGLTEKGKRAVEKALGKKHATIIDMADYKKNKIAEAMDYYVDSDKYKHKLGDLGIDGTYASNGVKVSAPKHIQQVLDKVGSEVFPSNSCKEKTIEAVLRKEGVEAHITGERMAGNLSETIPKLFKDAKVVPMSVNSDSMEKNLTNYIGKKFQDGDSGIIGFNLDTSKVRLKKINNDESIAGHAVMWYKEKGIVGFADPNPNLPDPKALFKRVDSSKEIELSKLNGLTPTDELLKRLKND